MPVSRRDPSCEAILIERVDAYAASPNGNRLASSIASSVVSYGLISARGPNGSSFIALDALGTSDKTVGARSSSRYEVVPAAADQRALLDSVSHEFLDRIAAPPVREWAHSCFGIKSIAHSNFEVSATTCWMNELDRLSDQR